MKLFTILFTLSFCSCFELDPSNLADDTRVNRLVSQKRRSGGIFQLDPSTELVMEYPPGSGRYTCVLADQNLHSFRFDFFMI